MSTTKPAREWLLDLPEPYRSQALEAVEKWPLRPDELVYNEMDAVHISFSWHETERGYEYWRDYHSEFIKVLTEPVFRPLTYEECAEFISDVVIGGYFEAIDADLFNQKLREILSK